MATGKHVILSGMREWISDCVCSAQCLQEKYKQQSEEEKYLEVISVDVHTRFTGDSVRIDIRYPVFEKGDNKVRLIDKINNK